ncbi:MAG TPA: Ig-like domain repeat protein [Acidobacteriaceae bacterium]|jgi:hypothetical protein|nr:Ig-like domain repeat protein [Acidobacteriaceae bacterium]
MATKLTISPRWSTTIAIALSLCGALLCQQSVGQTSAPLATSSVSSGLTHTTPAAWGTINATAITSAGDWLVQDTSQGALYEFPADGSPMITLLAPGALGSDPGFALDSQNTLYLEGNWANCILRFPYDPSTKTWVGLSAITPANGTSGCANAFVQYNLSWPDGEWGVQPKGLTTDSNNNIIVGGYNDNYVAMIPVTIVGGVATPGNPTVLMHSAMADPISVAVDKWENVYFVEDQGESGALPGVYEIPAGSADISGDAGLTRIDPDLPAVTAVATDPEGNVYVSDGSLGVFMIPAAGAPAAMPQTANAVLLTPDAAQGSVSIDWARQILYVPTTTVQSNGQADVAKVQLGSVEFGSTPVGTPTSPAITVTYAFNGSATPGSFAIQEDGAGTTDFATTTGGTCVTGNTYSLGSSCTFDVAANPLSSGGVSAKLLMLDASGNTLASTSMHAVGIGPAVSLSPALESSIGAGLDTPNEVAVDASGNSYVADAGLGQVLMYPKGSDTTTAGTPVGTGLTAPTGVAVDGAGDVLIADSGSVIEVPYGQGGLNAAGQLTLKTGLGSNLQLAADGLGNLYVSDPDNGRIVELGLVGATAGGMLSPEIDLTGFTAPAAIAVDASNNLFVIDNSNLIEVQEPGGTQSVVLSSLGAATGLALDPSGAVYAALPGGAVRIPSIGGVLTQSAQTTVASSVTSPTGMALDKSGDLYLADDAAKNLHMVSIDGALDFGVLSSSTSLNASLLNIGNAPLTVTGFSSSDAEDFTATGCDSPVDIGADCAVSVTANPGPGIQGPISSTITVQGNQDNSPVVIDATGTGSPLAGSTATISVDSSANVISIPVTVTVAPTSGTGTPTGTAVITVDGANPTNVTLSNGTASVTLSAITAGSHTFSVNYIGDRTYGSATASITATVAKGVVTLSVPTPPPYTLSQIDGEFPYDFSLESYVTNYVVTVSGAPGLAPTGTTSFMQGTSAPCGPSAMGTPAAGQVTFQPGCLPISANSDSPNVVTAQTITSIVYSGDSNYLTATASTTDAGSPILFEELRQPSVAIAPNPGSMTIASGTGSIQLSISSVQGYGVSTNPAFPSSTPSLTLDNYTLPIGFACAGLPAYATCTFSGGNYTDLNGMLHPDEVVVNTDPSQPVSITVTINTNIAPGVVASYRSDRSPITFAALFGMGLLGLASRRKFRQKARLLTLFCLVTLAAGALSLTSCSTGSQGTTSTAIKTPAGSYQVSVTAQQIGSTSVLVNGAPVLVYGSENQMSLPYTMNVTVQ